MKTYENWSCALTTQSMFWAKHIEYSGCAIALRSKDPNRKLKHRYLGTLLIVSRRQNDSRTSPVMLYIRSTTTPSWAIYLLSTKSWNHFRNSNLISMLLHLYQIFSSKICLSMYFFVCPLFLHILHATFSFRLFMIMSTLPIIYLEFFRRSMF